MTTQTDIFNEVSLAYNAFLASCVAAKMNIHCESKLYDSIDDMLNGADDCLSDVEAIAKRIDESREYERAHPEKQYDKYESEGM